MVLNRGLRSQRALADLAVARLGAAANMRDYASAIRALDVATRELPESAPAPRVDAVEYARRFARGDV